MITIFQNTFINSIPKFEIYSGWLREWLELINIDLDEAVNMKIKICSSHFADSQIEMVNLKKKLVQGSLPKFGPGDLGLYHAYPKFDLKSYLKRVEIKNSHSNKMKKLPGLVKSSNSRVNINCETTSHGSVAHVPAMPTNNSPKMFPESPALPDFGNNGETSQGSFVFAPAMPISSPKIFPGLIEPTNSGLNVSSRNPSENFQDTIYVADTPTIHNEEVQFDTIENNDSAIFMEDCIEDEQYFCNQGIINLIIYVP
jgi:hypothetical protein